jgi:hypothetical protein
MGILTDPVVEEVLVIIVRICNHLISMASRDNRGIIIGSSRRVGWKGLGRLA